MRFRDLVWLLVVLTLFRSSSAGVVLSEIMFDPAVDEGTDEFVELYNNSALPAQLAGWTISDGEGTDSLVSAGDGLVAAPYQTVLIIDPDYIEQGSLTYDGLVPQTALIVTIGSATFGSRGLSNSSSEPVSIRNADGVLIAEYSYTIGNLEGHSDERIRTTGADDSTNWADSRNANGTPGFRNSVTPPERDLALLNIDHTPAYPQAGNDVDLTVILGNRGLQNLSGTFELFADSIGYGDRFLLSNYPPFTILPGDCTELVDSVIMPGTGILQLTGIVRVTDDDPSNDSLTVLIASDLGANGIRINEIQFAPQAGRAEWIEIAVMGNLPVSTQGMTFSDGQGIADSTERSDLPEWLLLPGDYAVLAMDSLIFAETVPLGTKIAVFGEGSITLNNNGDSLVVFGPNGDPVDRVDYRSSWGGNTGTSLERRSLTAASSDPANWGTSVDVQYSSPGRTNSLSIASQYGSTEISVSRSPFTPNGDGVDDVTEIHFSVDAANSNVNVMIFDVRGRMVRQFSQTLSGREGSFLWDGRSDDASMMPTARYIIALEAENEDGGMARDRTTVILARPQ